MERKINLKTDIEESWLTFLGRYLVIMDFQSEAFEMQDSSMERALAEAKKYQGMRKVRGADFLDLAKLAGLRPRLVKDFPIMVLRSTLILVVSEFETFLVDCIRKILKHRKEFAEQEEPKTFHQRFRFLTGDPLRIDPGFPTRTPSVLDELKEIHATRNILVHNQGVVDKKYVQHLESAQFEIGIERPITREYVEASCNTILNTVVALYIAISEKYSTGEP